MPRTVKELMLVVLDAACLRVHDSEAFCKLSPGHYAFWVKLTHLGRKRGRDPEEVPDIDETAILTEEEYIDLVLEFAQLQRRSRPSLQAPPP